MFKYNFNLYYAEISLCCAKHDDKFVYKIWHFCRMRARPRYNETVLADKTFNSSLYASFVHIERQFNGPKEL